MLTGIFAIVQIILKLFGAWEQFLDWSDKKRLAEAAENTQEREKAVDEQKKAEDEKAFDDAQSGIVGTKPR